MGLFGSKTKVYVSSVVYNMAGDAIDRKDYLKSVVAQYSLGARRHKKFYSNALAGAMIDGPFMGQKRYKNWSENYYTEGQVTGEVTGTIPVSGVDVQAALEASVYIPVDGSLETLYIDAGVADYAVWAEQYMLENHGALFGTNWISELLPDGVTIQITFEDLTTTTFAAVNLTLGNTYIYVTYNEVELDDTRTQKIWIYEVGSGGFPAIDASVYAVQDYNEFYPIIPLRLENKSVLDLDFYASQADFDTFSPKFTRAYKKATKGGKISDVLNEIEAIEDIDDIDHCFMVYGVPLNAADNTSKKYIYEFLHSLIPLQNLTETEWNTFLSGTTYQDANTQVSENFPDMNTIRIQGTSTYTNRFRYEISWGYIKETLHTGVGKTGAVEGDLWFVEQPDKVLINRDVDTNNWSASQAHKHHLFWQTGPNSYKRLEFVGLVHQNFVYNSKNVRTDAYDALTDAEETGFIIPLHGPTLETLSMVDRTRLCAHAGFLVFNCYKVVKRKWWQSGFFRILLVIAIIVVSVYINPGAMANASGVLGTNVAVGAALGFAAGSTLAIIAGAIANKFAAMLVVMILQAGAESIFGDELGAFLGTIAGALTVGYLSGGFTWADLTSASNLMKLAEYGMSGYVNYAQARIENIGADIEQMGEEHEEKLDDLAEWAMEHLGYGGAAINPLMFTKDWEQPVLEPPESLSTFLTRTLLTGNDIVEISHSMIEDFSELSLELPEPTP